MEFKLKSSIVQFARFGGRPERTIVIFASIAFHDMIIAVPGWEDV